MNTWGTAVRLWLILLGAACLLSRALSAPSAPVPVIFIPGTTGTILRSNDDGRIQWGNGPSLLVPRDRGRALALPIDSEAGALQSLQPSGPILKIRIGPYRKRVYGPLLKFMQRAGYVHGDLEQPNPGEDFFFFSYDWRRSNVDNAGELARRLEGLRRVNDLQTLTVRLVAQSAGAHLARYFVKYAGAPLDEAERSQEHAALDIRVDSLILVGTSNGGALRVLRDLHRGRRYLPFGRYFGPEVLFTFRSMFEDLPIYEEDWLVDESGRELDKDLFDADNWRAFQWSIYHPQVAARLAGLQNNHPFGDGQTRDSYLRARLDQAKRFHRLLQKDVPWFQGTRYYSLQSAAEPTPARAVVEQRNGRWRTGFSGDRWVTGNPGLRASANGDGHATRESQEWLSRQERDAFARKTEYFPGSHFEIILNEALQLRLLEFLQEQDKP